MRESELLGFAWDDVDLTSGVITVRSQLQRREGGWALTPPKTKSGSRSIALAPDVIAALRKHEHRSARERRPTWKYFGLVFLTEDGDPLYGWRILNELYAHEDRLGLPHLPVYDLRHTAASLMIASGLSLEDVKVTLGHASIRTTSDTYSHQQPSQRDHVGAAMQLMLGTR